MPFFNTSKDFVGTSNRWWYYSIELLPNIIAKGQYEDNFPMLPRMMLRRCAIEAMECLDIGSMEGLIPALMARRGARRVLATDAIDHCVEKIAVVKHYHGVEFEYQSVGLMYELNKKLPDQSFDLINCSGLLYHVVAPFMVLAGVRPLLRRNGLMIVSTNVACVNDYSMEFNNGGRLQTEANTFWYISIPLFDYILRYLRLAPIDCLYLSHANVQSHIRYLADKPSGYLSVVCRAVDESLATDDDNWMRGSAHDSWEYLGLIDWRRAEGNSFSDIEYYGNQERHHFRSDISSIDLWQAVNEVAPLKMTERSSDTHILKLEDRS